MAHFARIDENNVVTQVVVVANKDTADADGVEKEHIGAAFLENLFGGVWKQTSYNGNIRKNYAGIGYTYDAGIDAFVPPQPYPSWILDNATAQWEAPVPMPEDAGTGEPPKMYSWDEATTSWVEVVNEGE
jgi:restriction endonuclease Mrr